MVILALLGTPAAADSFVCNMEGTPVSFTIDMRQFGPAYNTGEPIPRRVTRVEMGGAQIPAEPIMIGEALGFWAEGMGGSEMMLLIQPNGSAVYANPRAGERLEGSCEVTR